VVRRCAERVLDAWNTHFGGSITETKQHDERLEYYYSNQPLYPEDFGFARYKWSPDQRHKPRIISVDELARALWLVECNENQELRFADWKKCFGRLHRQQFTAIVHALIDLKLIEKAKGHSAKKRRAASYRLQ